MSADLQSRLDTARTELARIDAEQTTKIDAARSAFDITPDEKHASALAIASHVAELMIGKARQAVADIESEMLEQHRAELRAELASLSAQISTDNMNGRIDQLATAEHTLRRQLYDSMIALYTEVDRLRGIRYRCDEISTETGEPLGAILSTASLQQLDVTIGRVCNVKLREGLDLRIDRIRNAIAVSERP